MRSPIPPELRAELELEPRMQHCVVEDECCTGNLQWHHAVIYAFKALQKSWAIHAICKYHHDIADRKDIRAKIVKVIHKLGGDEVKEYERIKRL